MLRPVLDHKRYGLGIIEEKTNNKCKTWLQRPCKWLNKYEYYLRKQLHPNKRLFVVDMFLFKINFFMEYTQNNKNNIKDFL